AGIVVADVRRGDTQVGGIAAAVIKGPVSGVFDIVTHACVAILGRLECNSVDGLVGALRALQGKARGFVFRVLHNSDGERCAGEVVFLVGTSTVAKACNGL